MCNYYAGRTAQGQTIVYHVADGFAGEQALREIRRSCVGGSVKALSHQEAETILEKLAGEGKAGSLDRIGTVRSQ